MVNATGMTRRWMVRTAVGGVVAAASVAIVAQPAAIADQPPGPKGKTPVTFRLAKPDKPLVVLETKVNDQGPFRFVLDTGAGITMLTPELARKLDLEHTPGEKAVGAGGAVEVYYGMLKSLAIGDTLVANLKVGIMDLSIISKACGTEIDGIVGFNFLAKFRVVIDYPKKTVTFE